ncbi:hypothetical protein [Spirosoma koreense]
MTKKRLITYTLLAGCLLAAIGLIYVYREYMGEDAPTTADSQTSPIVGKRLNAVIQRVVTDRSGSRPKLDVAYTDIDTKETANFLVDSAYRQQLHVGDTITKDKWERLLLVYPKAGKIETIPID